jgi:thermitase
MKHLKSMAAMVVLTILLTSCIAVPAPTPEVEPAVPSVAITGKVAPNSVLVRYRPSTPPEKRSGARALANGKLVKEYKLVPGLEKLAVVDTPAALQALRHQPFVLYAEPDYVVSIDDPSSRASSLSRSALPSAAEATPNDPRFPDLWGMANIKAQGAWGAWTGQPDLVVAIIDTGIDYTHPDLAVNIWTNPGEIAGDGKDNDGNGYIDDVHGYDFVNSDGDPMDDHFHGPHTAGTVGAVGNNGVGVREQRRRGDGRELEGQADGAEVPGRLRLRLGQRRCERAGVRGFEGGQASQ